METRTLTQSKEGEGLLVTLTPYIKDGEEMWNLVTSKGEVDVTVRAIRIFLDRLDGTEGWNEVSVDEVKP